MILLATSSSVLNSAIRRSLRARAHALRPVVMIGDSGLTPTVLREVDTSLRAHELIKVRIPGGDHAARVRIMGDLCAQLKAESIQHIGKIIVLYRERPEQPPSPSRTRPTPRRTKRSLQGHDR